MSAFSLAELDLHPSLQKNLRSISNLAPPLAQEKYIAGLIYQGHNLMVQSESLFENHRHYCWIALIERAIRSRQNLGGGFPSWGHLSYCLFLAPTLEKSEKLYQLLKELLSDTTLGVSLADQINPSLFLSHPVQFIVGIPRRFRDLLQEQSLDPKQARAILLLDGEKMAEFNLLEDVDFFLRRTDPSTQIIVFQNQSSMRWPCIRRGYSRVTLSPLKANTSEQPPAPQPIKILKSAIDQKPQFLLGLLKKLKGVGPSLIFNNDLSLPSDLLAHYLTINGIDSLSFSNSLNCIKEHHQIHALITSEPNQLARDVFFKQVVYYGAPKIFEVLPEPLYSSEIGSQPQIYLIADDSEVNSLLSSKDATDALTIEFMSVESLQEPPLIRDQIICCRQDRKYFSTIIEISHRYLKSNKSFSSARYTSNLPKKRWQRKRSSSSVSKHHAPQSILQTSSQTPHKFIKQITSLISGLFSKKAKNH